MKMARTAIVIALALGATPGTALATHERETGRILVGQSLMGNTCRGDIYCLTFTARGCQMDATIDGLAATYAIRNIDKYTSGRARVADLKLVGGEAVTSNFEVRGHLIHKSYPCEVTDPGPTQYFEADVYPGDVKTLTIPKGTEYILFSFHGGLAKHGIQMDWSLTFRHLP